MEVLDSRRLTGPGLVWDRPAAVLDVRLSPDEAEQLIPAWQETVREIMDRLGLQSESIKVRRFADGASLAISAPIDTLYTATDINDWAWAAITGKTADDETPETLAQAETRLAKALAGEKNPQLIKLVVEAEKRGLPWLADDEELTLGLGVNGQTWPVDQLPEIAAVEWSRLGRIPLGLVTGTNGKTTSVRFLTRMARAAGQTVGVSSTDWIAVNDEILDRGDWSGPGGARNVLRDQRVDMGILETARGGLLRRGLGVASADAVLITNIAEDHLGEFGVMHLEELTDVKWIVTSALGDSGTAVLNAEDDKLVKRGLAAHFPVTWFSLDPELPLIQKAVSQNQTVVVLRGRNLNIIRKGKETTILEVGEIPLAMDGAARHNIANALGAIGLASALGLPRESIADGLRKTRPEDNPGRCNLFSIDGADVLVDFAHNPHGIAAIFELARTRKAKRRLMLIGQAGDRSDQAIGELAARAWNIGLDKVIIKEMAEYARGRPTGEVAQLIKNSMLACGAKEDQLAYFQTEPEAVSAALDWARPGDLLILFIHEQIDDVLAMLKEKKDGSAQST
ncbi:MAG: Mur ligase family protein [Gammaproteobacteria bacterium]|nr:Mur ligase family protein [Gammaproteobacteria bacterium]